MVRHVANMVLCITCLLLSPLCLAHTPKASANKTKDTLPLDEIHTFVMAYSGIKANYVDPISDKQLMLSAIRGLLFDLDPHSAYFSKEEAKAFDEQTSGAFEGIGVELEQGQENTLKIIAPIDDTPAQRAGLRSGDVIVAIDGKRISPSEASSPLSGKAGTKVTLSILRQNVAAPITVTLQREVIHIKSVRSNFLEPGYGYIRVSAFQSDSAIAFYNQLSHLKRHSASVPLRGLILDLRANPGGLLSATVRIANILLDGGQILSMRGRNPSGNKTYSATGGDMIKNIPIVVLVDVGSASASEVLAAALQDNHRAIVVGSQTFGKGSVQKMIPLDNGDVIKLTTDRYYTPCGRSIQAKGITPDFVLKPTAPANDQSEALTFNEEALPGHLRANMAPAQDTPPHQGSVLSGDAPIRAALAQLKKLPFPAPIAKAQCAQDDTRTVH